MALDHDCFNGKSSVGVKYERLEIDETQIKKEQKEKKKKIKKHLDEYEDLEIDGSDIFGTLNKLVVKPAMKSFSRIYRQYISSVSNYLITMVAFIIFYELLI